MDAGAGAAPKSEGAVVGALAAGFGAPKDRAGAADVGAAQSEDVSIQSEPDNESFSPAADEVGAEDDAGAPKSDGGAGAEVDGGAAATDESAIS